MRCFVGLFKSSEEVDGYQRNNRAKFVIPRLQTKIIMNVVFATLGIAFLSYILIDYLKTHQVQELLESTSLNSEEQEKITTALDIAVIYWATLCALFSIMLISFAVMLSHKIAGPVYHITRALSEYFEGNNKSRIFLRKGDEFIILEDLINRLIESNEKYKKAAANNNTSSTNKVS
jgi:nitrogen fixation/metabolism regulation signal transduction histidine kinase